MLRDRSDIGAKDEALQRRSLSDSSLTLQIAIDEVLLEDTQRYLNNLRNNPIQD